MLTEIISSSPICPAIAGMRFFARGSSSVAGAGDRRKVRRQYDTVHTQVRGYADTDIAQALRKAGMPVSVSLIDQVLRAEGLIGLRKRTREERERVKAELASGQIPGLTVSPPAAPETPVVADVRQLDVSEGRPLYSRVAGVFLYSSVFARSRPGSDRRSGEDGGIEDDPAGQLRAVASGPEASRRLD